MAVPLRRVDLQQHGLAERHEPGARDALQGTKQHQLAEAGRRAAQRRRDREADDRFGLGHVEPMRPGCCRAADMMFDEGYSGSTTQIVQGEPGITCRRSGC